jgi:hypothetical protein
MSRIVTDAVLSTLRADTRPIGDAVAPDGLSLPYAVLYSLGEDDREGDLTVIDVTGWHSFQVTSVGMTRLQAQALDNRLRNLLVASTPTVAGYTTGPWRLGVVVGVVDRDDDAEPPVYYSITTYDLFVAPS